MPGCGGLVDFSHKAGECFARSDLHKAIHTLGTHIPYGFLPTDRMADLIDQQPFDGIRVLCRTGFHIGDDRNPGIPVITNVEACPAKDTDAVKRLLIDQVSHSVRWEESIRYMRAQGVDCFVEVGPGKALTGFMRKIDKTAAAWHVEDMASLAELSAVWEEQK